MSTPTILAEKQKQIGNKIQATERLLAGTGLNSLTKEDVVKLEEEKPLLTNKSSTKAKKAMRNYINATEDLLNNREENAKLTVDTSLDEDLRYLGGDRPPDDRVEEHKVSVQKNTGNNMSEIIIKLDKLISILERKDK
jgi:hypothetical protein